MSSATVTGHRLHQAAPRPPDSRRTMSVPTASATDAGLAPVNGLQLYYESVGETNGTPLVLVHGGFGLTSMFGNLPRRLGSRRVISVDLQGHGRTADIDRPLRCETLGDDLAA